MRKLGTILVVSGLILLGNGAAIGAPIPYTQWRQAVASGADYLLQYRTTDGGFPWALDPNQQASFDPNVDGYPSTLGSTARGLLASYLAIGDSSYLAAANEVADLIEYRYDNSTSIGGYAPPFYNMDVTFAHELASVGGGRNITAKANASATAYLNSKLSAYSGDPNINTAALALRQTYIDSGWSTPGAHAWMLANWVHCGALLGAGEIYSGYTGSAFAAELYGLLEDDYGDYFDPNTDAYSTLGLVGIVEGAYFATGTSGDTDALARLKSRLATVDAWFSFQELGHTTYLLDLLGDPDATTGSVLLMDWQDPNGGWVYPSGNWYPQDSGEALLGLASVTVPEPTMILVLTVGATMVMLRRRRRLS